MQSGYHNLPKINDVDQMQGRQYAAKNSSFLADSRKAIFSTDISGAYTSDAEVNSWVRSYRLDRGKKFSISDDYAFIKLEDKPSTINFVTSCNVVDAGSGEILLNGDGFTLKMKYNTKNVTPTIEFNEVTDKGLMRYWPGGITRIVFEIKNPKLKGKNQVVIEEVK